MCASGCLFVYRGFAAFSAVAAVRHDYNETNAPRQRVHGLDKIALHHESEQASESCSSVRATRRTDAALSRSFGECPIDRNVLAHELGAIGTIDGCLCFFGGLVLYQRIALGLQDEQPGDRAIVACVSRLEQRPQVRCVCVYLDEACSTVERELEVANLALSSSV